MGVLVAVDHRDRALRDLLKDIFIDRIDDPLEWGGRVLGQKQMGEDALSSVGCFKADEFMNPVLTLLPGFQAGFEVRLVVGIESR